MTLRENIKSVIEQRLAVVAEEIFLAVERLLSDYEKEDFCCKQRVEDQRRAVDLMLHDHAGWCVCVCVYVCAYVCAKTRLRDNDIAYLIPFILNVNTIQCFGETNCILLMNKNAF